MQGLALPLHDYNPSPLAMGYSQGGVKGESSKLVPLRNHWFPLTAHNEDWLN